MNPELRFNSNNGEEYSNWEEKQIKNCLNYEQPIKYIVENTNYNDNNKIPVLTANKGFILGYTNELFGIYKKGDVIIYDDFTMDTKYVNFPFKVKSSAMKMLTAKDGVDLKFIYELIQSMNLSQEEHSRSYLSRVEPMIINLPSLGEQKKISTLLSDIDYKIEKQSEIVGKLKEIKEAMLVKMFPREGSLVPEIRFDGFSGYWEEKTLNDVATLCSSKRIHVSDYVDKGIPFYRGKEITELKEKQPISELLYITEKKFNEINNIFGSPQIGDILITAVGTLGNTWVIDTNTSFYFKDGNLIWFKNLRCDSKFLDYILNSQKGKKQIIATAIGSTQKALTMVELNKLSFLYPCKKEQEEIGQYFSKLDELIELQIIKLIKLRDTKKALLHKLLP